jgi:hypothetical protein
LNIIQYDHFSTYLRLNEIYREAKKTLVAKKNKKNEKNRGSKTVVWEGKTTLKNRCHHDAKISVAISEPLTGPTFFERVFLTSANQTVPSFFGVP